MNELILIIEDEAGAILTMGDRLKNEGYRVDFAMDGISGEEKAGKESFDLILLDIMLPRKDGISVCRDLRSRNINTPIIMISAKDEITDRVKGLKIGADDYISKPFDFLELMARIEAVIRRRIPEQKTVSEESISFGSYILDTRKRELSHEGERIPLSSREYQLLLHFLSHRGELLSRNELLDSVWGYDSIPSTRTVDVHVAWLRQKLNDTMKKPLFIQTVTKQGYRFIG